MTDAPGSTLGSAYPPPKHVLRDLGVWVEPGGDDTRAGLPFQPSLCDARGALRLSAIATLVDVVAGGFAIEAVAPDWVATSDLVVHRIGPSDGAELVATPRVSRAGRSTVVLEVDVESGGQACAVASLAFSRLEARGDFQQRPPRAEGSRVVFAGDGDAIDGALGEALGLTPDGDGLSFPVVPYVGNSLGAIQGGVVAMAVELAAERAVARHTEAPLSADELVIRYLGLGREGPMQLSPRVLRHGDGSALVEVRLDDRGAERHCSLAMVGFRG